MLFGKGLSVFRQEKRKDFEQKINNSGNEVESMNEFFTTVFEEWEKLSNEQKQQYNAKAENSENTKFPPLKKINFPSFEFSLSNDQNNSNVFDMNTPINFGSFASSSFTSGMPSSFGSNSQFSGNSKFEDQPPTTEQWATRTTKRNQRRPLLSNESPAAAGSSAPDSSSFSNEAVLKQVIERQIPALESEKASALAKALDNATKSVAKALPPPFMYVPGYSFCICAVPCVSCVPLMGYPFASYGQTFYPQMQCPPMNVVGQWQQNQSGCNPQN